MKINRKEKMALIVTHSDFAHDGEHIGLYATMRYCVLKEEGHPDFFFTSGPTGEHVGDEEEENLPEEIREIMTHDIIEPDDIEIARIFVKTDNDNDPAPENIPQTGGSEQNSVFGEWGHPGTCFDGWKMLEWLCENARVAL